jgi:AcrR family transcriptional regulator
MGPAPPTGGSVAERRREEIVAVARTILEEDGPSALTMRAIAERIGIRAPSLYKHFADKETLEVALIAAGMREIATVFEAALDGAAQPLDALARAYRRWALAHTHLYRLMNDRPLPRERLAEGLEARVAQPLIEATGGNVALARATWGMAHGLIHLELAGRFPLDADIDAAWVAGFGALSTAMAARPRAKRPARAVDLR